MTTVAELIAVLQALDAPDLQVFHQSTGGVIDSVVKHCVKKVDGNEVGIDEPVAVFIW